MKFLCVRCDEQMKLQKTLSHESIGSLSVVFQCPQCGQETAMLTNPGETQALTSLGVGLANTSSAGDAPKCPFSAMLGQRQDSSGPGILWTEAAAKRLNSIPEFVRGMAKTGIEQYAGQKGLKTIDENVLDAARAEMGI